MKFVFKSPLQTFQHIQNLQTIVDEINKLNQKVQWIEDNLIMDETKTTNRRLRQIESTYVTKEDFKKLFNYLDKKLLIGPVLKKARKKK